MHFMKRKVSYLLTGILVASSLTVTPFYHGIEVAAVAQEENINLMPNGNFDTVTDNWGSYITDGGEATIEQKDGALVCDIESVGTLNYSVQASCTYGFGLYKGGKYRLSFDVDSSVARQLEYRIQMNSGDYHAYVGDTVAINSETQTITVDFTMTEDTDKVPALCFNLGNFGEELETHTVTFDNIQLTLLDGSEIVSTVTRQEENVNLIPSGDFEEYSDRWGNYIANGGLATIEQKDGALVADIRDVGFLNYSVQTTCGSGFGIYQNGVYRLSFDISSTVPRDLMYGIQMAGGDYRTYVAEQISVGSETQTITIEFTMTEATDLAPALFFNMGIYNDEVLPEHTVIIDNVDLRLIDGSGIVYDDEEEDEQTINVNQIGYKTEAKKVAVVREANAGDTFKVISADDQSVVYEGQISDGVVNETADEIDYYADFSSVTEEGKYYIEIEGVGTSYEFQIGNDIFDDVFTDVFRFLYLQRCGTELDEDLAGTFAHDACHTGLARIYGTDEYFDVTGGWHDAGDYGRYVVATTKTVADLLIAYDENEGVFGDDYNIPESGNGQSDLLDEVRAQLEWLQKMQDKESGGVYHKVTCASFPGYVTATEETAELIVCPISTTATGDFAAVMGMGYTEFKEIDPEFANACLAAGEKAYAYLMEQPSGSFENPEGIVTGAYGDEDDSDERYWAAASLFKATGDSKYENDFKAYVEDEIKLGYSWRTVGSYGNKLYLSADNQDEDIANAIKAAIIEHADTLLEAAKADGYGVSVGSEYYWGSNMTVLDYAAMLMDGYFISGNDEYADYAKEHVNYILGKNPVGTSYVIGHGTISPQNPHHRPSIALGEPIIGALVGGPDKELTDNMAKAYLSEKAPAKCYIDHAESYATNEVDIYWNSILTRTMAEMNYVETKVEQSDVQVSVAVDTQVNETAINQVYTVNTDSTEAVDTSKLLLRYYFSKEDVAEMNLYCDYAGINFNDSPWFTSLSDSVTGVIQKTNAGYCVEVSMNDAVMLNANDGTLTITTRINNTDWSVFEGVVEGNLVVFYDGKIVK